MFPLALGKKHFLSIHSFDDQENTPNHQKHYTLQAKYPPVTTYQYYVVIISKTNKFILSQEGDSWTDSDAQTTQGRLFDVLVKGSYSFVWIMAETVVGSKTKVGWKKSGKNSAVLVL